jgi:hypothetical protein
MNTLSDLVGKETAAGKAFAVAASLISTYSAIAGQLSAFSKIPIPGYAIAQAVATGLAGFAAVRNILKVKVPGGAPAPAAPAGSMAMPTQAPIASAIQVTNTQTLGTTDVNVQNQGAVKAFVVESDITDSQDRVAKIKAAATL